MTEPRLTRQLFEDGGEDAYMREAIKLSDREQRAAEIRLEVARIGSAAMAVWPDRAMKRTLARYPSAIVETQAMCYLLAYNEEWESLNVGEFTELITTAASQYREAEDPDDLAYLVTVGLASDAQQFTEAREILKALGSTQRLAVAFRYMANQRMIMPGVKRRHRAEFLRACEAAAQLGAALGVLDHIGFLAEVPGSQQSV